MRIIAGKYKSRRISLPKTAAGKGKKSSVRPTSDRARETLFDVLNNYIEFEETRCLDLFAGTGSLGFEALSRGAGSCVFVDVSKASLDSIYRTAGELGCSSSIELAQCSAVKYLDDYKAEFSDIIFADPPYVYEGYEILTEKALAWKPQIFIVETPGSVKADFYDKGYEIIKKRIGTAQFLIFVQK